MRWDASIYTANKCVKVAIWENICRPIINPRRFTDRLTLLSLLCWSSSNGKTMALSKPCTLVFASYHHLRAWSLYLSLLMRKKRSQVLHYIILTSRNSVVNSFTSCFVTINEECQVLHANQQSTMELHYYFCACVYECYFNFFSIIILSLHIIFCPFFFFFFCAFLSLFTDM